MYNNKTPIPFHYCLLTLFFCKISSKGLVAPAPTYFEASPQQAHKERERGNSRRRQQEDDLFSEEICGVGAVAGCFV